MANLPISNPKTFTTDLKQIELTDPVHKDTMNPLFSTLINNEAYLYEKKINKGCTWGEIKGV
jgi:mRNA-degrading endonuclease YafQ of YafQ-DinJ toxin-antitoxin module